MEGYLSKKHISFNKIKTFSYVKPLEISGLVLAKLMNIYEPDYNKESNNIHSIDSTSSEKNSTETDNNLNDIQFYKNEDINRNKNKKGYYKSKRMNNNIHDNNIKDKNKQSIDQNEDNVDEFSNDYSFNENKAKIKLSTVNFSLTNKRSFSPFKNNVRNKTQNFSWKDISNDITISIPPICYKLIFNYEEKYKTSREKNKINFSNYLKYEYKINNSETLKNWNICNLNIFQKVHSCSGNAEFALFKTYIYLFIYSFFINRDKNESKKIVSDMKTIFKNKFYIISFTQLAIIYLFQGLCFEKGFEENISKSLLLLLLEYGDPRGRNNDSHGIIQFPLWIICRETLKLKEIIIYEYFKEMFQALEYFESKRNNKIYQNNEIVIDYINNMKDNIDNLKFLNKTNRYKEQDEQKKQNIYINKISTPQKEKKNPNFETPKKFLLFKDNFNSKCEPDYFINNKIFSKNYIETSKISNYFFPSFNNNTFSNIIDEFYNNNFAIYIFKQIQSIFFNTHNLFDNSIFNFFISSDILKLDNNQSQNINMSASNNLESIEPKMKEETANKTMNYKRKNKCETGKENHFMNLLKNELLDKISYKKNIPSGVIISFGNNVHNETSHENYKVMIFPRVIFKLKNVIVENIYSGWEHNVVISNKGEIFTFGRNQSYQCSLPNQNIFNNSSIPDPTNISELYNIYAKSISCGNEHTLILTNNKEVYGIGNNEDGVLGYNDTTLKSYKPLLIHFGENDEYTKRIIQISSGTVHNLSLTEDGKLFSWGAAMGGQLGHDENFLIKNSNNKKNYYISKPSIISSLADKKIFINKISCGEAHSIALTNSGGVYTWGFGSNGQLGLGFCEDSFELGQGLIKSRKLVPEKVNINCIKDIQCGKTFTTFINNNKRLLACGNNDLCQLGFKPELKNDGRICNDLIYPTIIDSLSTFEVLKIACGEGHCLAIINDSSFSKMKSLWSWGNNKFGQIGQGSIVKIGLPAPINLLLDYCNDKNEFSEISCGGFHSLCLIKRKKNINWLFDDFDKKIFKIIDDLNI